MQFSRLVLPAVRSINAVSSPSRTMSVAPGQRPDALERQVDVVNLEGRGAADMALLSPTPR